MCKPHAPDTSAQQAEAARQEAERQRLAQEQLKAQQEEWERQRQDAERRHQEQLKLQQDEIERQKALQEKAAKDAEDLRQQQIKQQEDVNRRGREFAAYRDAEIAGAQSRINEAYGGYNDAYFQDFADKFLAANRGDTDRAHERGTRDMRYKLADNRNLNSSAAADAFGELDTDWNSAIGKIAATASGKANDLRMQINAQKQNALNAIYGLGNTDVPDFQSDEDASAAKARIGNAVRNMTANYGPNAYV